MKRLMISALQSGSGKTVFTCGLLAAYKNRGLSCESFKCGPDYIDPMFHRRVLGIPSRNLDMFLQGEAGVSRTLERQTAELALIEGAMGFYDGINGTEMASPWHLANHVSLPVVLLLRPSGSALTLAAQIMGVMQFRSPCPICGLALTDCKPSLAAYLQPILERETGLPVLGFLPPMEEAQLPSRHLGLYTADEVQNFSERFTAIAAQMEQTLNLSRLLELASEVPVSGKNMCKQFSVIRCVIAVAKDEAFSFCYEDNLDALREAGAELVFFSPLHDAQLPTADALYLPGGYPELYAEQLSENQTMREQIHSAISAGMPCVAECGGFLYLQSALQTGKDMVPMAGILPGVGFATDRLQRFGYLELTSTHHTMLLKPGEAVPAHEFHYWDSTQNGTAFRASKANGKTWECGFGSETLYAAFPHLHFGGELPLAERFVVCAENYREKKNGSGKLVEADCTG